CGGGEKKTSTATTGGAATKTVALAFVGALTGDAANLGTLIRDGAKLAVEEANKKQRTYRIVLKEFDTQGDPAQATTLKDQFINDPRIVGVVGPAFSGETKALLPSLQEAGLPMVSASATNKDLPNVVPNQTVFHRIVADDTYQGKGIGSYIAKTLGAKAVVLVDDNSEYGKGLADDTEAAIKANGGSVAKRVTIDPKSQDYSAAVNDIKAANPDVVFYGGYYQQAGLLRKQLVDAGVKATFMSGDGSLDVGFIQAAGPAAEGALIGCPCNLATPDDPGPLGQFFKRFKATIGRDPGIYSPEGYDAANVLIEGILKGNDTREKLRNWLENEFTSMQGVSKTIEFEPNGNVKATQVFIFEVKGGKFAPKASS
ncbi:MAG: branched chain amino acid ABC transporter substrate-binding protein, partial [Acidimicrobiia bacterium]